jgi:hypothetical protein
MIRKEGPKYVLYSKDGTKKLGTFRSKEDAERREEIVRYFAAKSNN